MPSVLRTPRVASPRARHLVAGALVATSLLAGVSAPVVAQAPPDAAALTGEAQRDAARKLAATLELAPDSPPSPDDPFLALAGATDAVGARALARLEATARAQAATEAAGQAIGALQEAQAVEARAVRDRDRARSTAAEERRRLVDLTVKAFVSGGVSQPESYRAYLEGDTSDPEAGREIMFEQVLRRQETVTDQAKRDLAAARASLRVARAERAAAELVAAAAVSRASHATRVRLEAEAAHLGALADRDAAEQVLRSGARRGRGPVPLEVPLIGMPRLSAEDLASWFDAGPWRPRIPTPIADLARWFIEEGRTEGIRGDIAFAQAVLETGGFANTDSIIGHNYSGIGHYDNVALGFLFPSPQLGVRAQIQLLKSYAVRQPDYVHPLVDRRLRGPAGCCQTWGDLTTVWATDPTYGPKVMLLYTALVHHALDRRARGEGFERGPDGS
jgi:hypothetical protein